MKKSHPQKCLKNLEKPPGNPRSCKADQVQNALCGSWCGFALRRSFGFLGLSVLLALLVAPWARANSVEPREQVAAFYQALGQDRVEDAYGALVQGAVLAERPEDWQRLKDQTQRALDSYGLLHGYELLEEKNVGASLRRLTCLSLNHDLPLRWRFYFYRNPEGWKLVDLRVDDGLVELFGELGQPTPPGKR